MLLYFADVNNLITYKKSDIIKLVLCSLLFIMLLCKTSSQILIMCRNEKFQLSCEIDKDLAVSF